MADQLTKTVPALGPHSDDLKEKFQAQKIPLEGDFADLIDVANAGRYALGLAPSERGKANEKGVPNPGPGLKIGDDGRLTIKCTSSTALEISKDGYLYVKRGNGIGSCENAATGGLSGYDEIAVVAKPKGGLVVEKDGVSILTGEHLKIGDDSKLNVVIPAVFTKGMILMFSGVENDVPDHWKICDGTHGTPDLKNRFVLAAGAWVDVKNHVPEKVEEKRKGQAHVTQPNGSSSVDFNKIKYKVSTDTMTQKNIPAHDHIVGICFGSLDKKEDKTYKPGDIFPSGHVVFGHPADGKKPAIELRIGEDNSNVGEEYFKARTSYNYYNDVFNKNADDETQISDRDKLGDNEREGVKDKVTEIEYKHSHTIEFSGSDSVSHPNVDAWAEVPYYTLAFIMYVGPST